MAVERTLAASAFLLASLLAPALPAQETKPAPASKPAAPQEPDQATLTKNREAKLASEFLKNANWILDFDAALAEAKKTGKPIFGYFTRSYAH